MKLELNKLIWGTTEELFDREKLYIQKIDVVNLINMSTLLSTNKSSLILREFPLLFHSLIHFLLKWYNIMLWLLAYFLPECFSFVQKRLLYFLLHLSLQCVHEVFLRNLILLEMNPNLSWEPYPRFHSPYPYFVKQKRVNFQYVGHIASDKSDEHINLKNQPYKASNDALLLKKSIETVVTTLNDSGETESESEGEEIFPER